MASPPTCFEKHPKTQEAKEISIAASTVFFFLKGKAQTEQKYNKTREHLETRQHIAVLILVQETQRTHNCEASFVLERI
jgi:hypothetical protein